MKRKLREIEGFLQKCWNFDSAVSFWFLICFLCFFMFFKVRNLEFPFFASNYGKNLLQWDQKIMTMKQKVVTISGQTAKISKIVFFPIFIEIINLFKLITSSQLGRNRLHHLNRHSEALAPHKNTLCCQKQYYFLSESLD